MSIWFLSNVEKIDLASRTCDITLKIKMLNELLISILYEKESYKQRGLTQKSTPVRE